MSTSKTRCGAGASEEERLKELAALMKRQGAGKGKKKSGTADKELPTRKRGKSRNKPDKYSSSSGSDSESDAFESSGSASAVSTSSDSDELAYKKSKGKKSKHKHKHKHKSSMSFKSLPFFLGGDPILNPLSGAMGPFSGMFDVMPGAFPLGTSSLVANLPDGLFGTGAFGNLFDTPDLQKLIQAQKPTFVDQNTRGFDQFIKPHIDKYGAPPAQISIGSDAANLGHITGVRSMPGIFGSGDADGGGDSGDSGNSGISDVDQPEEGTIDAM